MTPYKVGQRVIIVRGSIDKESRVIIDCSWRPDQTEPDPIPMKDHWKAKKDEKDFVPMPMPCPSYKLSDDVWYYHFELKLVEE